MKLFPKLIISTCILSSLSFTGIAFASAYTCSPGVPCFLVNVTNDIRGITNAYGQPVTTPVQVQAFTTGSRGNACYTTTIGAYGSGSNVTSFTVPDDDNCTGTLTKIVFTVTSHKHQWSKSSASYSPSAVSQNNNALSFILTGNPVQHHGVVMFSLVPNHLAAVLSPML